MNYTPFTNSELITLTVSPLNLDSDAGFISIGYTFPYNCMAMIESFSGTIGNEAIEFQARTPNINSFNPIGFTSENIGSYTTDTSTGQPKLRNPSLAYCESGSVLHVAGGTPSGTLTGTLTVRVRLHRIEN